MADEISKTGLASAEMEKSGTDTMEQRFKAASTGNTDDPATSAAIERRAKVEKSLKRKLDARCSLFVLIYISEPSPIACFLANNPEHSANV